MSQLLLARNECVESERIHPSGKDIKRYGTVGDIGRRSQFIEWETGDTVREGAVFAAPVKAEVFSPIWLDAVWTPR